MKLRTELVVIRVEYDDAVFVMRELDTGALTDIALASQKSPAAALEETFVEAVWEWSGMVTDMHGNELECNEVNKRKIFAVNAFLVEDLMEKFQVGIESAIAEQKKISADGQNGTCAQGESLAVNAEDSILTKTVINARP